MATSEASTRRRVKLYVLNEERQWDDKGTGHVSALNTEQNNMALVVISESDGSCLLESKIQPDTAYQKQQETLIVWSEGENMDLALSFQEKVGCDDIWEKICNVQGKDPSVDITQDLIDESDEADEGDGEPPTSLHSSSAVELPPCEIGRLEEISDTFNQAANSMLKRERLASTLERSSFLKQLTDVFHKAEDLEDIESLHHLYDIMRYVIQFNKHSLYEIIFADDMLMDVIGMLEYNPAGRTQHRDFLKNKAHFKEVLPLHNPELISKIHQTYRVQYIQDCCLPPPSLFDENVLSTLTSFVFFNKIEIVTSLQDDDKFMKHLFTQLRDDETDDSRRRDLALFVKEFCAISVTLQATQKENFFSSLSRHGALRAVEVLLVIDDRAMKLAALDILNTFVEQQSSMVREFVTREAQENNRDDDKLLINIMIDQMINDTDPELGDAVFLVNMLKALIDPENMMLNNPGYRTEKTEFLTFFYRRCISTLTAPLFDNTKGDHPALDDYRTALVLSHVLELLTFCIENHTYHMKNHVFNKDLVKRVLVLLKSKHKFLVLGALRLLRRVVNMKEEFYNRYLIKNNLFKPVIDLFLRNGCRYNLVESALIELFEYIRQEDITSLVSHIIQNHWDVLRDKTYVQTFTGLKMRYEQNIDRSIRSENTASLDSINPTVNRFRREARCMDEEEEQWFDQDDEDEEGSPPAGPPVSLAIAPGCLSPGVLTTDSSLNSIGSSERYVERIRRPAGNGDVSLAEISVVSKEDESNLTIGSPIPQQTPRLARQITPIAIHLKSGSTPSSIPMGNSFNCRLTDDHIPTNFLPTDKSEPKVSEIATDEPKSILDFGDNVSSEQIAKTEDTASVNALLGLVDYSDEESEEDDEDEGPTPKRIRPS